MTHPDPSAAAELLAPATLADDLTSALIDQMADTLAKTTPNHWPLPFAPVLVANALIGRIRELEAEVERLRAENTVLEGTAASQRETGETCYPPDEAQSLFAELKRLRAHALTTEEAAQLEAWLWEAWDVVDHGGYARGPLRLALDKIHRIAERQP